MVEADAEGHTRLVADGERVTRLAERVEEMRAVTRMFEKMNHKYNLPEDGDLYRSCEGNPNLTIEDMVKKGEFLENLLFNLLPSIKEQITSLKTALDIQHDLEEQCPIPDVDLTLRILSELDQTLKSVVSSTVALTHASPIPDGKHDHHLKALKLFRCLQLRSEITCLVKVKINMIFESCAKLMTRCVVAPLLADPDEAWRKVFKFKPQVLMIMNFGCDSIDEMIAWSQKSDWAIVKHDWLLAARKLDEILETLTMLSSLAIDPTTHLVPLTFTLVEEPDPVEQTRRRFTVRRVGEVAGTTLLLVKLARIFVRTLLHKIPKKPIFELDTAINSETLKTFCNVFESMSNPLRNLVCCYRHATWGAQTITIYNRDHMFTSVNNLSNILKSTSTLLALRLLPLLDGAELTSAERDFKAWSLTLEQPWDTVINRLLDHVSSFEVEPEQRVEQED
ncbi:hypothetical protein Pst134EA_027697 [Puccinia striiformis f. sp. tritici]|uniref:hypothetical protein n=1 Tax=Puccinia striiformis f. sp. tritici TaxID=168172 RepID=UPI0020084C4E|nr:hypothetical protein Pst134EA_027697 [Puccinia striiformis f. sp. tritici]KAH9448385.1 hypothetical protein Pst134EA_027697 [Puccinia striiformis f. sp. tritici]